MTGTKAVDRMFGRFRKKPVEVDAILCSSALWCASNAPGRMPEWLYVAYDKGVVTFLGDHVIISTLEGHMRAEPTDIIIRGVKGELYPCKPDIFDATYEPVFYPEPS